MAASALQAANMMWFHPSSQLRYQRSPHLSDPHLSLYERLKAMSLILLRLMTTPGEEPPRPWSYFQAGEAPHRFGPIPVVGPLTPSALSLTTPVIHLTTRRVLFPLPTPPPSRGDWVPLNPTRLALPPEGFGGQSDLLKLLPEPWRSDYATPDKYVNPTPPSAEDLAKVPILRGYTKGAYPEIIKAMLKAGLLTLETNPPLVINGIFGVVKDKDKDRLIFDGRRANLFLLDPPHVDLPNPSLLTSISLAPGHHIFVSKSDVSNMYHRLSVPRWLSLYLGIPSLKGRDLFPDGSWPGMVYPVMRTLPMGLAHAVFLAHTAHLSVIRGAWPSHTMSLSHPCLSLASPDQVIADGYIDDQFAIAVVPELPNSLISASVTALDRVHLDHSPSKFVLSSPDTLTTELLGVTIHQNGFITPTRDALHRVLVLTRFILERDSASAKEIERLVGLWLWLLLLRRPLISLLATSYVFIEAFKYTGLSHRLPKPLVEELHILMDILPFLVIDLHSTFSPRVIATDASEKGAGVVDAPLPVGLARELHATRITHGWYTSLGTSHFEATQPSLVMTQFTSCFVKSSDWSTRVSLPWFHTTDTRIERLEFAAILLAFRCFPLGASGPLIVPFFTDSTSVLGSVVKGRSSSRQLNLLCRRLAAYAMVVDLRPDWLWVASEQNPADHPSRNFPK